MKHVLKIAVGGIATCNATVKEPYLSWYQRFNQQQSDMSSACKRSAIDVEGSISLYLKSAAQELLTKHRFTVPTLSQFFLNSSSAASNTNMRKSGSCITSFYSSQLPIHLALQNRSDIHKSNNASVEMAIADFFIVRTLLTKW